MSEEQANNPVQDNSVGNTIEAVENVPNGTTSTAVTNDNISLIDMVSEDYKSLVEGKGFKDIDDIAKSYQNLEKMVGNSVRIPSDDASDEAKQEFYDKIKDIDGILVKGSENFYDKLGRPEDKDGYALQEIASEEVLNAPGVQSEIEAFKDIAHEIGLTQEQAEKLVASKLTTVKESLDLQVISRKESESKLHEIWGRDFENRMNSAKIVAKTYAEKYPDAMNDLVNGPAGNNVAFLQMMSELGKSFKEQGHEGMQTAQFGMTPADAIRKISEKRSDKGFMKAYQDSMHPGHKKAVEDLSKLYSIAKT
jgi:hypothetical protein